MKLFNVIICIVFSWGLTSCATQSAYRPVTTTITLDESRFKRNGSVAIAVLNGGNFNFSNAVQIAKANGLDVVTNNKRTPDYMLFVTINHSSVPMPVTKEISTQADFFGNSNGKLITGTGYQTSSFQTTEDYHMYSMILRLEDLHSKNKNAVWLAICVSEWPSMYVYTDKVLQKLLSHYGKAVDSEVFDPSKD